MTECEECEHDIRTKMVELVTNVTTPGGWRIQRVTVLSNSLLERVTDLRAILTAENDEVVHELATAAKEQACLDASNGDKCCWRWLAQGCDPNLALLRKNAQLCYQWKDTLRVDPQDMLAVLDRLETAEAMVVALKQEGLS